MTEEEASGRVCCGPPVVALMQAFQANPNVQVPARCIGSECMAWRWSEEKRTAAYLQAVVEHMKSTGETFNKATQEVVKRRDEFAHTEGYCGLAGAL